MYCITLGRKSVALIIYSWSYYYESNLRQQTINVSSNITDNLMIYSPAIS